MNTNYSLIANKLVELQPVNWSKVIAYAQITEESYEICFYSKIDGKFYKNYELERTHDISRTEVRVLFRSIYDELLPDYRENHWYVCTIQIERNGHFIVEYEYTNYTENSMEYKKSWKEKYLKS